MKGAGRAVRLAQWPGMRWTPLGDAKLRKDLGRSPAMPADPVRDSCARFVQSARDSLDHRQYLLHFGPLPVGLGRLDQERRQQDDQSDGKPHDDERPDGGPCHVAELPLAECQFIRNAPHF